MLTRKQVAVRLGKSVATVRRLEGRSLFPIQDDNGVHRFDPDEVDAIADAVLSGELLEGAVDPWLATELERREQERDDEVRRLRAEIQRLRDENHDLRAKNRRLESEQEECTRVMSETSELLNKLGLV